MTAAQGPSASAHGVALETLESWSAPDAEQERLRASYVAHLRANPDGLSRACSPAHLTAGALVFSRDRDQVLLNLHRKAGIWVAFGGHLEPGDESLAAAALREATEESGIEGLHLLPGPAQLDVHQVGFCHPGLGVDHLDVRYLALAPQGAQPRVSEESVDVRWWPADDPPTEEPSMRALIALGMQA